MSEASSQNSRLLSGKTAIITGGASGIGLAIAKRFASHGSTVFVVDWNEDGAVAAAHAVADSGGKAQAFGCDVSDAASVRKAFDAVFAQGRVDILVNCAGVAHVGSITSTSEEDFDRILRINVRGVYLCTRAAVEHMQQHGGGVILNMASIAGSSLVCRIGLRTRRAKARCWR
jgi:2-keto-3-deoxy-L-fuconate dehydrogenase